MRKIIIITLLSFTLSACLTTTHVRVYEGESRGNDKVVFIKGLPGKEFDTLFFQYAKVDENSKNTKNLKYKLFGSLMMGTPHSAEMLPGGYKLKVRCTDGVMTATPTINVILNPGKTYEFLCQRVPSNPKQARAILLKSYKTPAVIK